MIGNEGPMSPYPSKLSKIAGLVLKKRFVAVDFFPCYTTHVEINITLTKNRIILLQV